MNTTRDAWDIPLAEGRDALVYASEATSLANEADDLVPDLELTRVKILVKVALVELLVGAVHGAATHSVQDDRAYDRSNTHVAEAARARTQTTAVRILSKESGERAERGRVDEDV